MAITGVASAASEEGARGSDGSMNGLYGNEETLGLAKDQHKGDMISASKADRNADGAARATPSEKD
ncbi:hypothetical protein HHA02_13200 [Cobetia marina]|jgi:hypothetical protein|nr:hypothetical protein HHA02_13200 [Cobetia marina]